MADPLWTSGDIARAVGGKEIGGFSATGVSIDTRTLEPGDLFVALAGARGAREIGDRRDGDMLRDGDILVVAGKGHEQGQIVAGVTHPFDDVAETAQALELAHA